jgi:hypothetical protein
MPVTGRIPCPMERGADSPVAESGTFLGLAFRLPVCVQLDQAVKLLERIVAARLESHLSRRAPGLHDSQFGFRKGRSTADAIGRVRTLVTGGRRRGYVALAVSLGVHNAFNSIPWVPAYLRGVVRAFLRDRSIIYTERGGRVIGRAVCRGVPQGSVMGPLLWDIAYDTVFRAPVPPDTALTCSADDTLVLVWGSTRGRAVRLAELAEACAVAAYKGFGLQVSPEKSEAMWFCRKTGYGTPPTDYRPRLVGAEIGLGTSMRYLGLTLDSH